MNNNKYIERNRGEEKNVLCSTKSIKEMHNILQIGCDYQKKQRDEERLNQEHRI